MDPRPAIEALLATAEDVTPPLLPAASGHPEETDIVLGWLEEPGVRLVEMDEGWACPVRGAEAYRDTAVTAAAVAAEIAPPGAPGLDASPTPETGASATSAA